MVGREELLALADRCEREEPSRELDLLIACEVLGLERKPSAGYVEERPAWAYDTRPQGRAWWSTDLRDIPDYTTSLDAAVTLVPEGHVWGAETFCGNAARVIGPEDAIGNVPTGYSDEGTTKTVALALCAAALRSRAAMEG